MDLVYCPRCGKLFARHFRDVCNNCYEALEKDYEKCVEHLRLNKGLNIQQLAEQTEISVKQITRWIKEGRISLMNAPNMSYPCEVCGILIREGHMCDSCKIRLQKEVRNATSGALRNGGNERHDGAYRIGDRLKDKT